MPLDSSLQFKQLLYRDVAGVRRFPESWLITGNCPGGMRRNQRKLSYRTPPDPAVVVGANEACPSPLHNPFKAGNFAVLVSGKSSITRSTLPGRRLDSCSQMFNRLSRNRHPMLCRKLHLLIALRLSSLLSTLTRAVARPYAGTINKTRTSTS